MLPAAQTPGVLVRPSRSTTAKPSGSTARPRLSSNPSGCGTLRGRMNTAARGIDASVGERYAHQSVGVDDESDDFAVDNPYAACCELCPVRARSRRWCG